MREVLGLAGGGVGGGSVVEQIRPMELVILDTHECLQAAAARVQRMHQQGC